jgi:CBS domain-containing protein
MWEEGPKMRAADVMTTDVVTVGPDACVVEVAETLLASRIGAVPVIGERGELVGIVSEGDLMRRPETRTERRRAWWLEAFVGRRTLANDYVQANAQKVGDIMTRNVVTATPDTPLGEIAALLERHHIKRVPVVRDGKVLGIVSGANLIQALWRVFERKFQLPRHRRTWPFVKTF